MYKHLTFESRGPGLSTMVDQAVRKMMDFIADKNLISHSVVTEWFGLNGMWVVIVSIVYQDNK